MSAMMGRQECRVQLEQSVMRLGMNVANDGQRWRCARHNGGNAIPDQNTSRHGPSGEQVGR